jgi:MFS transporter, PAT family, beta-lactamase induction signal transducer AmpG
MEVLTRNVRSSWRFTFYILAAVLAAIALLHCATLPSSDTERNGAEQDHELQRADAEQNDNETQRPELCTRNLKQSLVETLKSHSQAQLTSACLMLFVLPEALVLPVSALFVIDARHNGGLGLSPTEYGFAWASVGMAAFVAGLLLGNRLTRQMRLGRWLWIMAVAATAPNVAYLLLSHDMPTDLTIVTAHIVARQMLVGFGLAPCLRGLAVSDGQTHRTAVRFRRVAIVAMPMFVGGIYSGALQDYIGYRTFFGVAVATVACSLAAAFFQGVVKTTKTGLGC